MITELDINTSPNDTYQGIQNDHIEIFEQVRIAGYHGALAC